MDASRYLRRFSAHIPSSLLLLFGIPAQALFEGGSRTYVYTFSGASFTPQDVKLVRRSESQVVVEGLREGQVVALSNPEQTPRKKAAGTASPLPK